MTGRSGPATTSCRPRRARPHPGTPGSCSAAAAPARRAPAPNGCAPAPSAAPNPRHGARRIALVGETFAEVRGVMIEGAVRPARRPSRRTSARSSSLQARSSLAQRRRRADVLRRRSRQPARPAVRRRLVRRARQVAHARRRLGHAAVRACASARCPRAGGHHHAAADPAAEAPHRRRRHRHDAARARPTTPRTSRPRFLAGWSAATAARALGRQELDGEIVEDRAGALWRATWIDAAPRRRARPSSRASSSPSIRRPRRAGADACGIIAAGLGGDGRAYVLATAHRRAASRHVWARAAVAAYHDSGADRIVAETNQGGDLWSAVLREIDATVPVKQVHATRGKYLRAEPVAALYAAGPRRPRRRVRRARGRDVRLRPRRPLRRQEPRPPRRARLGAHRLMLPRQPAPPAHRGRSNAPIRCSATLASGTARVAHDVG